VVKFSSRMPKVLKPKQKKHKTNLPVAIVYLILAAAGFILWPSYVPAPEYFGINQDATNEDHMKTLREKAPGAVKSFRFIAFGDNRAGVLYTNQATKAIFEKMRGEENISFALNTGDISFNSREKDYIAHKRLTDGLPFPMLNVLGNHDVHQDGRRHFARYVGGSDFVFTYGPAYFVFMDNASGKFDENQQAWLREKLTSGQAYPLQIVVVHRPPFNPHYDPDKPLDFANYRDRTGWWDYGETFQNMYEEYGVDLVVAGHFHYFNEQTVNGVQYITTGGGGIIITEGKGGHLHYVVISVTNDRIDYELRIVDPPLWQYVFYYFWKDLFHRLASGVASLF